MPTPPGRVSDAYQICAAMASLPGICQTIRRLSAARPSTHWRI
ncbi:hypothetical protein BV133_2255 [Blastochloris viridis]|uniref:Uncharacterized protein n=1 Tax=Blastochloris viridis TaxID=1079 RepID=A0A182D3B9_BLAVI|nr:hypothetical protein BV133_2255 [Blastochloris viridis]